MNVNFSLKALLFLSCFSFLFASCAEDEGLEVANDNALKLSESIGHYHNVALDSYLKKGNNQRVASFTDYKEVRNDVIALLQEVDPAVFSSEEVLSKINDSDLLLQKIGVFSSAETGRILNTHIYTSFPKILTYLVSKNEISSKLADELNVIYTRLENRTASSTELLQLVNGIKGKDWSEKDRIYVESFVQVYNSSYDYWKNYGGTKSSRVQGIQADGDTVIMADAVGALYGSILGPAWSIIEGALFSIVANNQ